MKHLPDKWGGVEMFYAVLQTSKMKPESLLLSFPLISTPAPSRPIKASVKLQDIGLKFKRDRLEMCLFLPKSKILFRTVPLW